MSSVSCNIIKVLKTEPIGEYNRIDIRIVKWSNSVSPVLEKRRMWIDKEGKDVTQKLMGFDRDDLVFVLDNLVEIENLIKGSSNEIR